MASSLTRRANMRVLQQFQRSSIHTINSIPDIQAESPVLVYDSPEFQSLQNVSQQNDWSSAITSNENRSKFFSLIPFFIESKVTSKFFVLRMELLPKSKHSNLNFIAVYQFKLHVLRLGGVFEMYVPVNQFIPITPYDYWCASWMLWFKQNNTLDLDMIYANHVTKEMYLFDKSGQWKELEQKSLQNHEELSMEKTYNETDWYDENIIFVCYSYSFQLCSLYLNLFFLFQIIFQIIFIYFYTHKEQTTQASCFNNLQNWKDEGVYHEVYYIKNLMNFYDEFYAHNF